MNDKEFTIYFNEVFFDHLYGASFYNDRPEPNRMHAQTLWTIYQVMKAGDKTIAITDNDKNIVLETADLLELKAWMQRQYPNFNNIFTARPASHHPGDQLKRPS